MKTIRNLILITAFTLLIFWGGYQFGSKNLNLNPASVKQLGKIVNQEKPATKNVDFSLFWLVWDRLENFYIDKTKLDPQKMVYGAISGLVNSLGDPYTVFLDPTQYKESKEDLSGQFEGVGMQLGLKDKKIVVIAPLKDTPADKAGIIPGDFIYKVNGEETTNWTLPEAVAKIRGQRGTKVTLTIVRGEVKPQDYVIVRDTILVKSVEVKLEGKEISNVTPGVEEASKPSETADEEIAYLKLSKFGDDTIAEWDKSVAEIADSYNRGKTKALILDLRNNPGGYLSGAVTIASEFLSSGVVVKQDSIKEGLKTYSVSKTGKLLTIPLVVLINKGSASASEIVAGALRDYKRATLVGEKTFGKGSIQEVQELIGGVGLHITTAKWLLPKGEWINGKGIDPDVKVEADVEKEAKDNTDTQLDKAKEILKEQIE